MIVGCKLPSGFTIEVGMPGDPGYEFFNLAGGSPKKPGFTTIPDEVWIDWLRNNRKFRYIVDGSLYAVP